MATATRTVSQDSITQWTAACRAAGVDPAEVRVVWGRYQAYCRYYEGGRRGEPLTLEQWFGFYRMEAESESGSGDKVADGCSVDPEARGRAVLTKPAEFLGLLQSARNCL